MAAKRKRVGLAKTPIKTKRITRQQRALLDRIRTINRFYSGHSEDLTPEAVAFGAAMQKYLIIRRKVGWKCGEVLDVMMDLGYVHPNRKFEILVQQFTDAITRFKKKKYRFPSWQELLTVAEILGWKKRKPTGDVPDETFP